MPPPRWGTPRNPDRLTLGPQVSVIMRRLGTPPMPWQSYVNDVAFEVDPDTGTLAYREVRLTVPRQSGKTTITLGRRVHRCTVLGDDQVSSYTAQTGVDARKKFIDGQLPALRKTPFGRMFRTRLTNGHEAMLWQNGSIMNLIATTEKSGHGGTIDDATIDEAFAQPDSRIEQALRPAMITRRNAQLLVVSSMGWLGQSEWWHGKIDDGRERVESGLSSKVAHFEWSAPEDADIDDEATWWACMPALGHTVDVDAIRAERDGMDEADFRRAYLNQRVAKSGSEEPTALPVDRWLGLADHSSRLMGIPTLAVDVTPDRARACIAGYGSNQHGVGHAESIDHRSGVDWIVARAVDLSRRWGIPEVALDSAGPAASLAPDLDRAGIAVRLLNTSDITAAAAGLYDAVMSGDLCHLDQSGLNAAVAGARRRAIGDRWAFGRRVSEADISPLVAISLARHVHASQASYDLASSVY